MVASNLMLGGKEYVVLSKREYRRLLRGETAGDDDAGLPPMPPKLPNGDYPAIQAARVSLARQIIRQRRAAGLSQAELARRAKIRVETLNRIERAKVSADVSTVEKIEKILGA